MNIRIGGIRYEVEYVDSHEISGSLGRFMSNPAKMLIAAHAAQDVQKSTLLHEVIEALNFQMELGLKHRQIMSLEHGLFQVMRDNPELFSV